MITCTGAYRIFAYTDLESFRTKSQRKTRVNRYRVQSKCPILFGGRSRRWQHLKRNQATVATLHIGIGGRRRNMGGTMNLMMSFTFEGLISPAAFMKAMMFILSRVITTRS